MAAFPCSTAHWK